MLVLSAILATPIPLPVLHELRGRLRLPDKKAQLRELSPLAKRWAYIKEHHPVQTVAILATMLGEVPEGDVAEAKAVDWLARSFTKPPKGKKRGHAGLPPLHGGAYRGPPGLDEMETYEEFVRSDGYFDYEYESLKEGHHDEFQSAVDMAWHRVAQRDSHDDGDWADWMSHPSGQVGSCELDSAPQGVYLYSELFLGDDNTGATLRTGPGETGDSYEVTVEIDDPQGKIPAWLKGVLFEGGKHASIDEVYKQAKAPLEHAVRLAVGDGSLIREVDREFHESHGRPGASGLLKSNDELETCQNLWNDIHDDLAAIGQQMHEDLAPRFRCLNEFLPLLYDWVRAHPNAAIGELSFGDMFLRVLRDRVEDYLRPYREEWESGESLGVKIKGPVRGVGKTETFVRFKDGADIVELLNTDALKAEGRSMNHCIGSARERHPEMILSGRRRAFSYRDSEGVPHATWEIDSGDLSTKDLQGFGDSAIMDRDARDRMLYFIVQMRLADKRVLSATPIGEINIREHVTRADDKVCGPREMELFRYQMGERNAVWTKWDDRIDEGEE